MLWLSVLHSYWIGRWSLINFALADDAAALIIVAGTLDPECVRIGGQPFGEVDSEFADAFALSWTTFSTVVRTWTL